MGLYDHITIMANVENEVLQNYVGKTFQTDDLGCVMRNYRIEADKLVCNDKFPVVNKVIELRPFDFQNNDALELAVRIDGNRVQSVTVKMTEVDNLLLNMSAGLNPDNLSEHETNILEHKYGENWRETLGY